VRSPQSISCARVGDRLRIPNAGILAGQLERALVAVMVDGVVVQRPVADFELVRAEALFLFSSRIWLSSMVSATSREASRHVTGQHIVIDGG
jgi:hypothetical protein